MTLLVLAPAIAQVTRACRIPATDAAGHVPGRATARWATRTATSPLSTRCSRSSRRASAMRVAQRDRHVEPQNERQLADHPAGVTTSHPGAIDHERMADTRIRSRANGRDVLVAPMPRLVDEMLDRYVEWREDADAVRAAYGGWSGAPAREKAWRFSVYMAALEQEESAATSYASVVGELDRWLRQMEVPPKAQSEHVGELNSLRRR